MTVEGYDHRELIGGLWEEIGNLQLHFMIAQGLKRDHYLLDVGCGSLRGGVHFIDLLDEGHYYGIDNDPLILKAGREIELGKYHLGKKKPVLALIDDFNFLPLKREFDFALAQSVFTHLNINSIIRCLVNVEKVLKPGGRFYATFFESNLKLFTLESIHHQTVDHHDLYSYFDQDPYHYHRDILYWIGDQVGLDTEYIGDWSHPRDQKMMVFSKK